MEDYCFSDGFMLLKETLSSEELSYPVDERGLKEAKQLEGSVTIDLVA